MVPDEFNPDEVPENPAGDEEARPAVFVTTREPISLVVERLEDSRAPEASALGAYIEGRLVARSAMPPEAISKLLDLDLFGEPVPLGLFAYEEDPGLQCRLFALVPRSSLEGESHADEPWKESVPSFEATGMQDDDDNDPDDLEDDEDDEESIPFETILLGHIVRFERDRRHPDDLAAEAVDILQRIIHGNDSLEDADRKAIDDLLGSL